jgi:riboflavin kinase/FMN adenylyltransferase
VTGISKPGIGGSGAPPSLRVFRGMAGIPVDFGPSIAAIGNFDGVHLGHRQILAAIADEVHSSGARSIAVTFDPHPEQFLRPAQAPRLLTPIPERLRLLATTGIDAVAVLPFNAELANLTAREFARSILAGAMGVRALHEGRNFRFGRGAEAGVAELESLGAEMGFTVRVHSPVRVHGLEISSSAIRALVATGDMRRARWMLGRPFSVLSTQARGRGIGTRLLVPTVNLAPYSDLLPAFGVRRLPMATTAKIIAIGNSAGIILPKETLARLNVQKGDTLYITEGSQGIRLLPFDTEFAAQMEAAREVMRENRDVLQRLAE